MKSIKRGAYYLALAGSLILGGAISNQRIGLEEKLDIGSIEMPSVSNNISRVEEDISVESSRYSNDMNSKIPEEHRHFYESKIYPTIAKHIPLIFAQDNWVKELSEKDLYHVHLYFKGEFDNPRDIHKLRSREKDITYLYHSKELINDSTNRNIFIDGNGRFEAFDGTRNHEGREIVSIYFSDSSDEMKGLISTRSFLDEDCVGKIDGYHFATSDMNYRL